MAELRIYGHWRNRWRANTATGKGRGLALLCPVLLLLDNIVRLPNRKVQNTIFRLHLF
jgi:hypothetical protein